MSENPTAIRLIGGHVRELTDVFPEQLGKYQTSRQEDSAQRESDIPVDELLAIINDPNIENADKEHALDIILRQANTDVSNVSLPQSTINMILRKVRYDELNPETKQKVDEARARLQSAAEDAERNSVAIPSLINKLPENWKNSSKASTIEQSVSKLQQILQQYRDRQ